VCRDDCTLVEVLEAETRVVAVAAVGILLGTSGLAEQVPTPNIQILAWEVLAEAGHHIRESDLAVWGPSSSLAAEVRLTGCI
jgi:hypothetical protein